MKLLIVVDEKLTSEGILKAGPDPYRRAHAPHERRGNGRGDT